MFSLHNLNRQNTDVFGSDQGELTNENFDSSIDEQVVEEIAENNDSILRNTIKDDEIHEDEDDHQNDDNDDDDEDDPLIDVPQRHRSRRKKAISIDKTNQRTNENRKCVQRLL